RRRALVTAVEGGQRRLTRAFIEAPAQEEAEGGALERHVMTHGRGRVVDPRSPGPRRGGPQTQVGVFRAGPAANLAEVVAESPDRLEHRPGNRHSAGPYVTHRRGALRHPAV